jgi:signal transduction histidine kinase
MVSHPNSGEKRTINFRMTAIYYYTVLLNAVISFLVAAVMFWKNRYQAAGPLLGVAMMMVAGWLVGFAHYFRHLESSHALVWAYITLFFGIAAPPTYFHSISAVVDRLHSLRLWIAASYLTGLMCLVLLFQGHLIVGFRPVPFMDHYLRYNPAWYGLLIGHIALWQWVATGLLIYSAWRAVGYRRTQLIYYSVAWGIVFFTCNLIIVPLEYNISVQPFGFFILPWNLAFIAYASARARLSDFNAVIARALLYTMTLLVVVGISLLVIVTTAWVAPTFLNPQQTLFAVMLSVTIGVILMTSLPRLLPRAERMMQERMFGKRYGYQDTLANVVKGLSRLSTIEDVLNTVATTVHSQIQVSRVIIFMQDVLTGNYKLRAESGLGPEDDADALELKEDAGIVKWLSGNTDTLVREEMARRVAPGLRQHLETELDRLKVNVCVPMILDNRLVGLIGLGEKLSRDMFFISDLRLLETLATEVALAVKYRRMEDEVSRQNRLVELGTIAAGVAHEIRNPLASIKTFAQLMPERMDDPEFKNEFSKLVLKDVDRITKVIESMLAFARPAQVTIGEYPANDLVEEAILLVQPRLKSKRIELTREFHGNPVIKVDKHQILQVLVNLLSNAADALHEQGKIRVATGLSQRNLAGDGSGKQNYAVIEVSDNGPGIPSSVRGRLFDPFFTTKKEGTGLGLSISQKIARDHGGAITVSSVEGKGTSFQVNLPMK